MYAKALKSDGTTIVEGAQMLEVESAGQWDVQTVVTEFGVRIVKTHSATQSVHVVEIPFRDMKIAESWSTETV